MKIEFDPDKRNHTLAERGLDFLDAPLVIDDAVDTLQDTRFDYPEDRLVTFGRLRERLVVVVWIATDSGIRVISNAKGQ